MPGTVTHATAQGPRPAQEDRFLASRLEEVSGEPWLIAVMDGHAGSAASDLCADRLEAAVREQLGRGEGAEEALRSAIAALEGETREVQAGTSLTAALIEGGRSAMAVLGDSPLVYRDASGEERIGPVHNALTDPEGRQAALRQGAEYAGGYLVDPASGEGVALTRVLGDARLSFLERSPEVFGAELGTGSFVLCATDGVFTRAAPGPEGLVAHLVELVDGGADAEAIVSDALETGTDDNVTVVLWRAGE